MKTFECATINRQTSDCITIHQAGTTRPFEVELLGAGGIEAEVAYEGDARGCPHCISRALSNGPEVWAA